MKTHSISGYKRGQQSLFALIIAVLALSLGSCTSYKNVAYFRNIPDTLRQATPYSAPANAYRDILVKADDILQVDIQTIDPRTNEMMGRSTGVSFNSQPSSSASAAIADKTGFLVDKEGYIDIPLAGRVKVGGLTTDQIREAVRVKAAVYYKEPVVNVRFSNFRIVVLGEVARPATYTLPNERVNLLDAIGMAGDLTIYGKRENVLLIREEGGERKYVRFNLNSTDIFNSPYYQLHQGDVVYVEPNKSRAAGSDATQARNFALASTVAGVLGTISSVLIVYFSYNR